MWDPFREIPVRFDEKTFSYSTFVLFYRTLDPIDVIAIPIRHRGDNPVIAGSRMAEKPVWKAGHHLTDAELMHRPLPRSPTIAPKLQRSLRRNEGRKGTICWHAHGWSVRSHRSYLFVSNHLNGGAATTVLRVLPAALVL
jgi:hypothetical protein